MPDSHTVGVAFALNIAAGSATILGGMVVFSKHLVYVANPRSLAIALSLSAGVMIFISLVEIFGKSRDSFFDGIYKNGTASIAEKTAHGHAWLLATACCSLGIAIIYALDALVRRISPTHDLTEIENLDRLRDSIDRTGETKDAHGALTPKSPDFLEAQTPAGPTPSKQIAMDENSRRALIRMGILSAIAIGIHNFPEGIATYVSAVQDPSVGFALAVGIGIHNIPEGIAVAAPVYFATGSRWRGVMWSAISAAAEPLGGVIAWLAMGDGLSAVSEGVLFGLVCGIMTCICVKELWPTAFKFARDEPHLVAFGTYAGMLVMVVSLTLFGYAGEE
ncbi:hypothetical protein ATCC90586_010017 [Pythium insidiosum]|nr:hypothetical protein ATCC90586_010017 [Pythium insidiosum]